MARPVRAGAVRDRERVKLLFGPYKSPALRRGDRATCLYRDCDVRITGWTDARTSWPVFAEAETRSLPACPII